VGIRCEDFENKCLVISHSPLRARRVSLTKHSASGNPSETTDIIRHDNTILSSTGTMSREYFLHPGTTFSDNFSLNANFAAKFLQIAVICLCPVCKYQHGARFSADIAVLMSATVIELMIFGLVAAIHTGSM
jgi:hypothetical protein